MSKYKNYPHDSFQNLIWNRADEDGHWKLDFSNESANIYVKKLPVI